MADEDVCELGHLVSKIDFGRNRPHFSNRPSKYELSDKSGSTPLKELVKPHLESYNYMMTHGLKEIVKTMAPLEFDLPQNAGQVEFSVLDIALSKPTESFGSSSLSLKNDGRAIYPNECRLSRSSYRGRVDIKLCVKLDGKTILMSQRVVGQCPVMVQSSFCNLSCVSDRVLAEKDEESREGGGYFIVNGGEKIVRLLIGQRRNYPSFVMRSYWQKIGTGYSEYGIIVRCIGRSQLPTDNFVHYIEDGTCTLSVPIDGKLYYVPFLIVLKALTQRTDLSLMCDLLDYRESTDLNSNLDQSARMMLQRMVAENIRTPKEALCFLGTWFRDGLGLGKWRSDEDCGRLMVDRCIFTHLPQWESKYYFGVFCMKKLYMGVQRTPAVCRPDPVDTTMIHELITPGQVVASVMVDKIQSYLRIIKMKLVKSFPKSFAKTKDIGRTLEEIVSGSDTEILTPMFENFFSTGNLSSRSNPFSVNQSAGWVIMAERINFLRNIAHFRSVHRGAPFTTTRISSVRRLCPESFGFICPVNTPDGALCGLLNHLTVNCVVVCEDSGGDERLVSFMKEHGMLDRQTPLTNTFTVVLDGDVVGYIEKPNAHNFIQFLRERKTLADSVVPRMAEFALVEDRAHGAEASGQDHYTLFPGLYVFTSFGRMMRPVLNLAVQNIEYVGSFEQVFLGIATDPARFVEGFTTHHEIVPYSFLSLISSLTPFSEFNQSPRNMYQCQLLKQTMGTPCHHPTRSDQKLYRLTYGQSPLLRTKIHDFYNMEDYPMGTNAVVAVMSYTGYDMEDAMILNKSSVERGFAHGTVYFTEVVDLAPKRSATGAFVFGLDKRTANDHIKKFIGPDGLPHVGCKMTKGDPFYGYISADGGKGEIVQYKKDEEAFVVRVMLISTLDSRYPPSRAAILMRMMRNPIIGDKFASRHGQKGVCSRLYPLEDLPFNEMGMTPDIIFNPHGFPSRMTMGMMLEFMATKYACTEGVCIDGTPFQFDIERAYAEYGENGLGQGDAFAYFGNLLKKAGFNYYGKEAMYSGTSGELLEVDIFMGVVYYQKLRHMVSDKFQVRRIGQYDTLTHQPLKGRRRGGGIRVGEMERDAILSHGCSFTLIDRLMSCSDQTIEPVCTRCGLLQTLTSKDSADELECRLCKSSLDVCDISIPYVLKYLISELSSMNIATVLTFTKSSPAQPGRISGCEIRGI